MAKVKLPIYQRTQLIGGDFGTGDPYWDNVVFLLQVGSFRQSQRGGFGTIIESKNNRVGTFTGLADISTTAAKWGTQSYQNADDNSDSNAGGKQAWTYWEDNTDWQLGADPFTFEWWMYPLSTTGTPYFQDAIVSHWNSNGVNQRGWSIWTNTDAGIDIYWSTTGTDNTRYILSTTGFTSDQWNHVVICRDGTNVAAWINGVHKGAVTFSASSDFDSTARLTVGDYNNTDTAFNYDGYLDDIRITKGVARYDPTDTSSIEVPKAPYPNYKKRGPATSIYPYPAIDTDPYFSSVTLLLPFDGTDGAASPPALIDQSSIGHTGNFVNQAQLDTAQKKFGTASALFDGTLDYIAIPDHISLSPEGQSFTVEAHVRFNGTPATTAQMTWASKWNNGFGGVGVQKEWWIGLWDSGHSGTPAIQVFLSSNGSNGIYLFDENWSPTGDTWYHIAVVFDRDETTDATRVFVDGTQLGTDDTSINSWPTFFDSLSEVWIGSYDVSPFGQMNGWIDNVRITKGVARYKTNFTPPTAAYPTS